MDSNKLRVNLEKLKKSIPKKPATYTPDFPVSIAESLQKYLRQRTISVMRSACWIYDSANWPLPLYVDPENIKIGYLNEIMFQKLGMNDFKYFDSFDSLQVARNEPHPIKPGVGAKIVWLLRYRKRKKLQYYDWMIVPIICRFFKVNNLDDFNLQLFDVNSNYFRTKIFINPILKNKYSLLQEIFDSFQKKNYASCICTLYPLLDFITRDYFETKKFSKDISMVNAVFKAAGFEFADIDNLKPGAPTKKYYDMLFAKKISPKAWEELAEQEYGLGFPGVALSSFLHFSYKYYEYYRSESIQTNFLNRHAIIHGASNQYGTKINAVKLLTYLYLMLELEPVLKIVFSER
ncbi:MAG TPA: hypothetical protein VFF57_01360 [Hanamia sp.]|nr:hypothetical protein [Hanamia sp.]